MRRSVDKINYDTSMYNNNILLAYCPAFNKYTPLSCAVVYIQCSVVSLLY